MADWTDIGWRNFVDEHDVDEDEVPRAQLLDMKEAWLHGARTAIGHAERILRDERTDPEKDADSLSSMK